MKTSLFIALIATSWLMGGNLVITQAEVQAHTEVFGDASINPVTTQLKSHLTINKSILSLKGSIDISMNALKSDKDTRDEHMAKAIESKAYPLAKYSIDRVKKTDTGYKIKGILNFHGVRKPLIINAKIIQTHGILTFKGSSSFLMSDYDVTPPKMFFLTVRDRIDLKINTTFQIK